MNRKLHLLLTLLIVASCMPAQTAIPSPETTPTIIPFIEPTATFAPPAITATLAPTITSTHAPIPCDPRSADYCIADGYFLLQRPIQLPANVSVDRTYPYASTADGTRDPHRGVEFVNESGTPVRAAGEGMVIFAGPDDVAIYSPWREYYGNLVVIEHESDLFTLYAHLSKIDVEAGSAVKAGEKIGEVGRSGVAIGSHLHFEVRQGDAEDYLSTVNPELWLIPSQPNFGVIEFAVINGKSEFQKTAITLQRVDQSNDVLDVYYVDTYHSTLALGRENAAIGDLSAGKYRIVLIFNGKVYERWVEVESGKLTQVVIVVK